MASDRTNSRRASPLAGDAGPAGPSEDTVTTGQASPGPRPAPAPARWEEYVVVLCMAMLVVITLLNVVTRYLSDDSFAWTEEFSVALMVVMTLAGASTLALRDAHIRIEFFFNRRDADGQGQPRRTWQIGGLWLSTVFFCGLTFLFARQVYDQIRFGETSMGLGVPLWWYSAVIPPICLAIAWRSFTLLRRLSARQPS